MAGINVRIKRLILDGLTVPHAERPALQAAVESELARLLAEGGLSPALQGGGAQPSLPGGRVELQPGGDVTQLGGRIARAVYEGMGS